MKPYALLGPVSVVDGQSGEWSIETFDVTDDEARLWNVRAAINGRHYEAVHAGSYKRLMHARRGVVMTNTPMEITTNLGAFYAAKGRVLINGLGIGMLLEAILRKPEVEYVRVIELEADVIKLVWPVFAQRYRGRAEIVHADAFEYQPAKGERFDFVWHDIWDDICSDNLETMAKLHRKYARRCDAQASWGKELAQEHRRRWRASSGYQFAEMRKERREEAA